MRAWPLLIIIILGSANALAVGNSSNSSFNLTWTVPTYNFKNNITVSTAHKPTYTSWFTKPVNYTINYSKTPKAMQGVTPQLKMPTDLRRDVVRNQGNLTFDPRSCKAQIAYCYQVLEHPANDTKINPGKNYSSTSTFRLPEERIRTFVCLGNDTSCVKSATNCFCPQQRVPTPPQVLGQSGKCSSTSHLCLTSAGSFVLCEGNLTFCQQHYTSCGCGPAAACPSKRNTCVNARDQLTLCKGAIGDCLAQYDTCFCGPDMLPLQQGCTTYRHNCVQGNKTVVCQGKFTSCALQYDKCEC